MIGPSSSHTAGAAKLARIAAIIAAAPFSHVTFSLAGSFAKTYRGHGTDKALVAGVLGIHEDDERLVDAFEIAKEKGLSYSFEAIELEGMHENSVRFSFYLDSGEISTVIGSSTGGAQIIINRIGEYAVDLTAISPALLVMHNDKRGLISTITSVLSYADINIATMKLSRHSKGETAFTVIETDSPIDNVTVDAIAAIPGVISAQAFSPQEED